MSTTVCKTAEVCHVTGGTGVVWGRSRRRPFGPFRWRRRGGSGSGGKALISCLFLGKRGSVFGLCFGSQVFC